MGMPERIRVTVEDRGPRRRRMFRLAVLGLLVLLAARGVAAGPRGATMVVDPRHVATAASVLDSTSPSTPWSSHDRHHRQPV